MVLDRNVMLDVYYSKKSPTGPTERTPQPEYLIAQATCLRGPLVRSHSIFDGTIHVTLDVHIMLDPKNDGFPNAGISFSSGLFSGADC